MNIESRIFSCVPELWKPWFLKHITLKPGGDLLDEAFSGVSVKNGRIYFYYDEDIFNTFSDEDINLLIKHEVAHIIRGDVLVKGECNNQIANIAMDVIINNILGSEKIGEYEGQSLEVMRSLFPEIPKYPSGWREIYDIIMKYFPKFNFNCADKVIFSDDPNDVETVIDAITDLMIDDPRIIKVANFKSNIKHEINIKVTTSRILESIITKIKGHFGNKMKKRTYRKEHPTNDMLKNISRIPINKILLVLDVSGSYIAYTETIIGLFYWLDKSKNLISDVGVFSNNFNIIPKANLNNIPGYGGGTEIKEMFQYLQKNPYDLVIVFTDGEIFDYDDNLRSSYKGKILWVLDDDYNINIYKKGIDEVLVNDKIFGNVV